MFPEWEIIWEADRSDLVQALIILG
jgi:hypothetical protein